MFEIVMIMCLINDFGADSRNECFIRSGGTFQTKAACYRQVKRDKIELLEKFRAEFGDDYVYLIDGVCSKRNGRGS